MEAMGPAPPLGGGHDGGYGTSSTIGEAMMEAMGPAPPLGGGHDGGYGTSSTIGGGHDGGYGTSSTIGGGHVSQVHTLTTPDEWPGYWQHASNSTQSNTPTIILLIIITFNI